MKTAVDRYRGELLAGCICRTSVRRSRSGCHGERRRVVALVLRGDRGAGGARGGAGDIAAAAVVGAARLRAVRRTTSAGCGAPCRCSNRAATPAGRCDSTRPTRVGSPRSSPRRRAPTPRRWRRASATGPQLVAAPAAVRARDSPSLAPARRTRPAPPPPRGRRGAVWAAVLGVAADPRSAGACGPRGARHVRPPSARARVLSPCSTTGRATPRCNRWGA